MKRIFGISLITGLIAFSQMQAQYLPDDEEYYKKFRAPLRNSYFSLDLGLSIPTGTYGSAPSADMPLLAPFLGEDGMGAGLGMTFSFGGSYSLSSREDQANRLFPTLRFGGDISHHGNPDWSAVIPDSYGYFTDYDFDVISMVGFEIGPGVSYNINNILVLELAWEIYAPILIGAPTVTSSNAFSETVSEADFDIDYAEAPEGRSRAYMPGHGFSFAIRQNHWRLYIEYFAMRHRQYYEYTSYDSNQNELITPFTSDFSVQTIRTGISLLL